MRSCLYKVDVMHHRRVPKRHRFNYRAFMFWIDLDELDLLAQKIKFLSIDRFNLFSFRKKDHLILNNDLSKTTKQHFISYLAENGFEYKQQKIFLLTNLSFLGYNFNPVSFYFVMDENTSTAECAVAEVSNTFREMKLFFIGKDRFSEGEFRYTVAKHFYVSPFLPHDNRFDFRLRVPEEKLSIRIDSYKDGEIPFISTLTGRKKTLTNASLLFFAARFPFITLRIVFLIHWNALLLWLKGITYRRKNDERELQRNVLNRIREKTNSKKTKEYPTTVE
jgi:DUF1365 family protein